jgi:hypothetical protein
MQRFLSFGVAGEVKPQAFLTSPAAPFSKVTRHFVQGRSVPSFEEGIKTSPNDEPQNDTSP